jgi:hypothetical protein
MAMQLRSALFQVWPAASTGPSESSSSTTDRRQIQEPYRQAFGREHTKTYGRSAGWMLMSSAIEKIGFPAALIIMALLGDWEAVIVTMVAETILGLIVLVAVMKGQRISYLLKGIAVAPIRYALLATEFVTLGRFAADLWLTGNRKWRK